jgi:ankyrin repeat protein
MIKQWKHCMKYFKSELNLSKRSLLLLAFLCLGNKIHATENMQNSEQTNYSASNERSLTTACTIGQTCEVLRLIKEEKVSVNFQDQHNNNSTPLHTACQFGKIDVVRMLLKNKANLAIQDELGNTALHRVCDRSDTTINASLADDVKTTNEKIRYMLQHVVADSHPNARLEIINILLKEGIKQTISNDVGEIALHIACYYGSTHIVETLLNKYKSPDNAPNVDGNTPLNQCESLVNAQNIDGNTPLHYAAALGFDKIIKLLLDSGASINISGKDQNTPLHMSCENGSLKSVKLLLERDANINAENADGKRPITIAVEEEHLKVVTELIKHGAETKYDIAGRNYPNNVTHQSSTADIISMLMHCKTISEEEKYRLLWNFAISNKYPKIVNLLLKNISLETWKMYGFPEKKIIQECNSENLALILTDILDNNKINADKIIEIDSQLPKKHFNTSLLTKLNNVVEQSSLEFLTKNEFHLKISSAVLALDKSKRGKEEAAVITMKNLSNTQDLELHITTGKGRGAIGRTLHLRPLENELGIISSFAFLDKNKKIINSSCYTNITQKKTKDSLLFQKSLQLIKVSSNEFKLQGETGAGKFSWNLCIAQKTVVPAEIPNKKVMTPIVKERKITHNIGNLLGQYRCTSNNSIGLTITESKVHPLAINVEFTVEPQQANKLARYMFKKPLLFSAKSLDSGKLSLLYEQESQIKNFNFEKNIKYSIDGTIIPAKEKIKGGAFSLTCSPEILDSLPLTIRFNNNQDMSFIKISELAENNEDQNAPEANRQNELNVIDEYEHAPTMHHEAIYLPPVVPAVEQNLLKIQTSKKSNEKKAYVDWNKLPECKALNRLAENYSKKFESDLVRYQEQNGSLPGANILEKEEVVDIADTKTEPIKHQKKSRPSYLNRNTLYENCPLYTGAWFAQGYSTLGNNKLSPDSNLKFVLRMQDPNGRNKISACGAWAKLFEKNNEKKHYKEGQYIHASYHENANGTFIHLSHFGLYLIEEKN